MAKAAKVGGWGGGPKLLSFDEVLGWTPFAWLLYLPIFLTDPIAHSRAGVAPVWLWPLTISVWLSLPIGMDDVRKAIAATGSMSISSSDARISSATGRHVGT